MKREENFTGFLTNKKIFVITRVDNIIFINTKTHIFVNK